VLMGTTADQFAAHRPTFTAARGAEHLR
jgi:hypothetical protein